MRPASTASRFPVGVAFAAWALAYVAALPLQAVVVGLLGHADTPSDELPTSAMAATVLCLWVPLVVALVLVSRRWGAGSLRDDYRIGFRAIDLVGVPIGVVCQLALVPLLYWPLTGLFPDTFDSTKVEERANELWNNAHGGWVVVLIAIVAVGAPIVEEFVYRGLVQNALESRINEILALVIGAAWFAAIHLQPVELPGLFLVGLVFGACWQRTGRLSCSVLAHVAFNATGLVLVAG